MIRVVGIELLVCACSLHIGGDVPGQPRAPLKTRGHSRTLAHSMQCSGSRGVLAMVQMGKVVGGVRMSRPHS
jgi:hypothetical protein